MTDLLLALGKANIAAAAAVLAVILIRKPARQMFGARQAYRLWLIIPLAAFAVLIPRIVFVTLAPVDVSLPLDVAFDPTEAFAPFEIAAAPPSWTPDYWFIGACVWLAGMLAMAAWLLRKQSEFVAEERKGKAGPAVVGLMRPRIVTPSNFGEMFNAREQAVIIEHETTHIRRNDARANGVAALIRCVCWFNPLIHVAAHLMRIDQELACDAQVIERHPKARRTYAEAMLKAELAGRVLPLGCYWPAGARHPLTERIAMLKLGAPGRSRRIIGLVSLAALALAAGCAAWSAQPEHIEYVAAPDVARPIEQPQPEPIGPQPAIEQPQPARDVAMPVRIEQPPQAPQPAPVSGQILPTYAPLGRKLDDRWAPVSLSGTITDVKWVNPNVRIFVHGDDGKDWYVLTSTPNHVMRSGGSRDIISKNAKIKLDGHRATDVVCAPLCVAMAWETDMAFNGAKLVPSAMKQMDDAFQPPMPERIEQPQPAPADKYVPFQPPVDRNGMTVFVPVYLQNTHVVDPNAPLTVTGTLMKVEWVNPATIVHVREASGKEWRIVTGTPNSLIRLGGTKDFFKSGAQIVARGHGRTDKKCDPECQAFVAPTEFVVDGARLIAPPRAAPAPSAGQAQPAYLFVPVDPAKAAPAPEKPQPTGAPAPWGPKPASIREAIEKGNAWFVPDLGGTPDDMMAALKVKMLDDPALKAMLQRDPYATKVAELITDGSRGATFTYLGEKDGVRSIKRNDPNGFSAVIQLKGSGGFGVAEPAQTVTLSGRRQPEQPQAVPAPGN